MSDLMGAIAPPADYQGPTVPIEGRRRKAGPSTPGSLAAQVFTTPRSAACIILAALALVMLLRALFRGALGD